MDPSRTGGRVTTTARGFDVVEAAREYRQEKATGIRKFMKTTPVIWECREERPFSTH